jgi:DNA-directed RNA polymerase subunit H (RpoH/RPB5)
MDADTLDLILRSRPTIVEILHDRGYDTSAIPVMTPETLMKCATTSGSLLTIHVNRREDGLAEKDHAVVQYWVYAPCRLRIESELEKLFDTENPDAINPETTEAIIILSEAFHDAFHLQAAKQWAVRKAQISFFHLKNIISNPRHHMFVPPHRKLSNDEINALVKSLHLQSKYKLANIKYHVDMQARVLGLVPGSVVAIERPSESSGLAYVYRVCTV